MQSAPVIPSFDFETRSEAGRIWNPERNKWDALPGAPSGKNRYGLPCVGAAVYAEHPSTGVLSLAYDLKNGRGPFVWLPGPVQPLDLLEHVAAGGLIQSWNVAFERWIWNTVCVPRYGWPPLAIEQLRCVMGRARAHSLPGGLDEAGRVLNLNTQKDTEGTRLIKLFCEPRNPTKKDPRVWIRPEDQPQDAMRLYQYNVTDIAAEDEAASRLPPLEGEELEFWKCDFAMNARGVKIDIPRVKDCIAVVEATLAQYDAELFSVTGGIVAEASKLEQLKVWLATRGVHSETMDEGAIAELLKAPLPPEAKRALEIRQAAGSASVKKVYSMLNQATRAGRLHDLFAYYATRTGRVAGRGPQPTNLPSAGPPVHKCLCAKWFSTKHKACPWCGLPVAPGKTPDEWSFEAVACALNVIATRSVALIEYYFGGALDTVSGCLRGLFIADDGGDLICSDYNSIEAVVAAVLTGEKWRLDVFRTHGKIYEMSASKITGIPFEAMLEHRRTTGQHHASRKLGKVSELSSAYQGWIGAWVAFGADEFLDEEETKRSIIAWRAASPSFPHLWGGQWKNELPCMYGIEGAAISAVLTPGTRHRVMRLDATFSGITYEMRKDVLYCELPSGRELAYHAPRLEWVDRYGNMQWSLSFEGWNTNPKNGPVGWIRMRTWGGRLFENICQAVARDILRRAIINLEAAGYAVVMQVYDEIIAEVAQGFGSIEELERLMNALPEWAAGWPIRASGGWRGFRYRKGL